MCIKHLPNTVVPLTLRSIIFNIGIQKLKCDCFDHLRVLSSGVLFNLWAASGPMASTYCQRNTHKSDIPNDDLLTYLIEAACKSKRWVCCCSEIKIVSRDQDKPLVNLRHIKKSRSILTICPRSQSVCNCSVRMKAPPRQTRHQHRFSPQITDLPYHLSQISTHRFRGCYFLIIVAKLNCHQCTSSLCYFTTNSSDGNVPETTSSRIWAYIDHRWYVSKSRYLDMQQQLTHPLATKLPVVAPLWAVLIQGVPAATDAIFPVMVEPQSPLPQPPLFGVVLWKVMKGFRPM